MSCKTALCVLHFYFNSSTPRPLAAVRLCWQSPTLHACTSSWSPRALALATSVVPFLTGLCPHHAGVSHWCVTLQASVDCCSECGLGRALSSFTKLNQALLYQRGPSSPSTTCSCLSIVAAWSAPPSADYAHLHTPLFISRLWTLSRKLKVQASREKKTLLAQAFIVPYEEKDISNARFPIHSLTFGQMTKSVVNDHAE